MSGKQRSRSKSPKKKKVIKNIFDIVQFKKMLGKNMIKLCNVVSGKKAKDIVAEEDVKKTKEKILSGSVKTIALHGYVSSGVIYIFKGIENLIVISHLTYSELKKNNVSLDIVIFQYEKLSKEDVLSMI